MSRTWRKRPYKIGDEHEILRLRQSIFGDLDEVRLNISTWYWQFQRNPAGNATCWLAEDNGVIVGQYTVIPTRFSLKGQEALLAFSCDTMVHPGYRKQGMFSDLANELYRSLDSKETGGTTVWGFPNEASLPGFTHRLGWNPVGIIPLRIMPIRPLTMFCEGSARYPDRSCSRWDGSPRCSGNNRPRRPSDRGLRIWSSSGLDCWRRW